MSESPILFHSPTSPYVRKVMVLLHETDQLASVTLHGVTLTPVNPSAEVNQHNPAGKIPALRLDDGSVLHDSRVILDYFDHQHGGEPLIPRDGATRWRRLTLASLADAVLDAAILVRYETFLRPEDKRWDDWVLGQCSKIDRALESFEAAADELDERFDVAAISAVCALGYLDFRMPGLNWRRDCPKLAAWYASASQRPSVRATAPTA
ncbi:glutathione S-transferase family protein [Metapseudomonas furukawaii]|jgi:glutathione S-transferase|uniref:Glutathione S-transferase family protein n=1 Tax=Metapseudomonas furukawaii TaxID=1149133 RepID=A0AAD1BVW2_METFU|nr:MULTISPECIES: glutathione S-transferase family protein [Pseudomonas]ELS27362.1 Glutathione S-transferase family protein [Pseudomonas furukawaii]OWJ98085.1 glutathione S-transferase [Pseudomonas sp. A46]WAG79528.1 glutathione S-transferase family protein [Pseudomonas furukawaii]BAU72107.1 glutathione S-transferase family protein [Pseudomonas furukawaii]